MTEAVTFFFGKRLANRFEFAAEDSHHLCRVLRHSEGDLICAIDGSGTMYEVRLEEVRPRRTVGAIINQHTNHNESPLPIILVQGLVQQSKMDWLVEKATELGVHEIRPVAGGARVGPGRQKRWLRLARSAAKQCRRGRIPEILEPGPLSDILAALPDPAHRLLLDPGGQPEIPLSLQCDHPVIIAVGPEKGFSAPELNQFRSAGFEVISLGMRRLRAETAAIAGLAALNQHLLRLTAGRAVASSAG